MSKKTFREQKILEYLCNQPGLNVHDLASYFNVSDMTIRRDLADLIDAGLIDEYNRPIHSASSDFSPVSYSYYDEGERNLEAKKRIAQTAITFVEKNDSIIIDSGTTTQLVTAMLPADNNNTIITYSAPIMNQLFNRKDIRLVSCGGYYHIETMSFESYSSVEFLSNQRAGKMFIAASGIHDKLGVTCSNGFESSIKQAGIQSSNLRILLADSYKFGKVCSGYITSLDKIDVIITDSDLSEEWLEILENKGIELYLV